MSVSQIIEYKGDPELLVWRVPQEQISPAAKLVVDAAHEAVLFIDGNPEQVLEQGKYNLDSETIPVLGLVPGFGEGAEAGTSCQIYYISKGFQRKLLWGTANPLQLQDPDYEMLITVMAHGNMSYLITDSVLFLMQIAKCSPQFTPKDLQKEFRAIIGMHVNDYISRIMIDGQVGYLKISRHVLEISGAMQEKLTEVFAEYGVEITSFIVEEIAVPDNDLKEVQSAERRRAGRRIEGYTWQDERGMAVADKIAGKDGSLGKATDEAFAAFLRKTLNAEAVPADTSGASDAGAAGSKGSGGAKFCPNCGAPVKPGQKFCTECGTNLQKSTCPNCGEPVEPGKKFCANCGCPL